MIEAWFWRRLWSYPPAVYLLFTQRRSFSTH